MFKYLLIGAGVLLVVVLAVFFIDRPKQAAPDPLIDRLSQLADLAERTCLSNTSDQRTAQLKVSLDKVRGVQGAAGVESRREAARGAAAALPAEVKQIENDQIRQCMEPWSQQLRDMASAAPAK